MGAPVDLADRLRRDRREVIAALSAGTASLASLDAEWRAAAAPVKVVSLVEALPGVGKVRGRRILDELGVAHSARWGELPRPVVAALERAVHDEQAGGEP